MGLPVGMYVRTRDPDEFRLLDDARHEGHVLLGELMTDLARKIVKEYADAQDRGAKRSK